MSAAKWWRCEVCGHEMPAMFRCPDRSHTGHVEWTRGMRYWLSYLTRVSRDPKLSGGYGDDLDDFIYHAPSSLWPGGTQADRLKALKYGRLWGMLPAKGEHFTQPEPDYVPLYGARPDAS